MQFHHNMTVTILLIFIHQYMFTFLYINFSKWNCWFKGYSTCINILKIFIKYFQIAFLKVYNLHSYQQHMRVPIILPTCPLWILNLNIFACLMGEVEIPLFCISLLLVRLNFFSAVYQPCAFSLLRTAWLYPLLVSLLRGAFCTWEVLNSSVLQRYSAIHRLASKQPTLRG